MEQNPYAAPRSAVDDVTPEPQRRPVLVWIICVLLGFGCIASIVTSLAALAGQPIGGAEAVAHLTALDHIELLVSCVVAGAALVDLFRLKRRAFPLFAASLAISLAGLLASIAFNPVFRVLLERAAAPITAISWIVNFSILAYIWRLRRKGVLK